MASFSPDAVVSGRTFRAGGRTHRGVLGPVVMFPGAALLKRSEDEYPDSGAETAG